ncbi:hypothetical protein GCM10009550_15140 [Actinocorallia libanotica]|uniref:Uncharacterized protein n=1 Tax=Actinocorallia libanotica TaxID=46162 RepID=A0ABP4B5L9_9ACTN
MRLEGCNSRWQGESREGFRQQAIGTSACAAVCAGRPGGTPVPGRPDAALLPSAAWTERC